MGHSPRSQPSEEHWPASASSTHSDFPSPSPEGVDSITSDILFSSEGSASLSGYLEATR